MRDAQEAVEALHRDLQAAQVAGAEAVAEASELRRAAQKAEDNRCQRRREDASAGRSKNASRAQPS
jgi:hypothetical protein